MIVLMGSEHDPHIRPVGAALSRMGCQFAILDYALPSICHLALGGDGSPELVLDGRQVDSHDIFFYYPKLSFLSEYVKLDSRSKSVFENSWRAFYRNIAASFESQTVNRISAIDVAHNKFLQLIVANRVGLEIPETKIANDHDVLSNWLSGKCPSIIKSLSVDNVSVEHEDGIQSQIMTTRIDFDLVANARQDIELSPSFVQREIEKQYELRVCVIGDQCFAFKIDSQKFASTQTDWRYGMRAHKYHLEYIPDTLRDALKRYLVEMQLEFGHFDIVVDGRGKYIFLECNPQGSWAWLDDEAEGGLAAAYAQRLIQLHAMRKEGSLGLSAPSVAQEAL